MRKSSATAAMARLMEARGAGGSGRERARLLLVSAAAAGGWQGE